MSEHKALTKEGIIANVVEHINQKIAPEQAKLVSEFARQYLKTVVYDELAARSTMDLYGALLSMWELISKRKHGECKIHIYNPNYEQHGWESTHTIVEVANDDMPFIVDSLQMELNRLGINTHLIIHYGGLKLRRNSEGVVTEVLPFNTPVADDIFAEAPILIEIDRQTDPQVLDDIAKNLRHILGDVRCAVEDWSKMRTKLRDAVTEIENSKIEIDPDEVEETKDFLRWLENDHFTLLGYRAYKVTGTGDDRALELVENSGLGVLRDATFSKKVRPFRSLTPEAREQADAPSITVISQTNTRATVHRPAHTVYIGIKRYDKAGVLCGEHRFIGLYTSTAYTSNPRNIPILRRKVALIMKNSNLSPTGHAAKALLNILETFPRDDLFQASTAELQELSMGILALQERKRIRLFIRMDVFHRFLTALVYVPRDRFETELGYKMQEVLKEAFNAIDISFTTWFSESALARIHYVIRIDPKQIITYDIKKIEDRLVEVGRSWKDDLKQSLLEHFGEERGNILFNKYQNAFDAGYRETFNAKVAVYDIEHMEAFSDEWPLRMSFYRPLEEAVGTLRFKLFRPGMSIALSDSLPIFENMGLRVLGERSFIVATSDNEKIYINDFSLVYSQEMAFDVETIKQIFQEAFLNVWNGNSENDGFNRLILGAGLSWREITIIRSYAKYLRQIEFTYSQAYIESCLAKYPNLALLLVQLFILRFDPTNRDNAEPITQIEATIRKEMDAITVLDEDRILRRVHEVINATLRTNYFQAGGENNHKTYLALKLDPKLITDMPLPLPMYEIFVYSPAFEGVHLRSSKVARGGLRWSDRREDFRTEVLGLMKAQNVKNAVIVPSGAKGGFVPKNIAPDASREQVMQEGIACYKNFIRGLLDITDNIVGDEVVNPTNVVCYDDADPYLVVAADKGTATFSDIANSLAIEHGFWLKDAFASGGSTGYDHKKIAITARGAWESVKRHFRELNVDIQTQDFTVVGIGDMSGDVFGNGMLLSHHIKLVAAFDHRHIFLDPNPDPEASYNERQRLFNLSRSSWDDYSRELISKGGGVYPRQIKAIQLSAEIQEVLNLKKDSVSPPELIRAILKAPVDLLWNGGIGTYVKSSSEENINVGDRTNDGVRVNGKDLLCRIVGEGGNLGFTQLGRVEFELSGGLIFTDFIDNSGGVDCSDHEVNVKILLNDVVSSGDLTEKQRDILLVNMTEEVASLVLDDNYHQTEALNLAAYLSYKNVELHQRYIQELVRNDQIDRELEFLPSDETLMERKAIGKGLTRPELAILFAYSKNIVKKGILDSDIPEEPYLAQAVDFAFPKPIRDHYQAELQSHRLRREIIATVISNGLINETGITFLYLLHDETGASTATIIRAYAVTRNVFSLPTLRSQIEALDYKVPAMSQVEMMVIVSRLTRRATRWFIRNRRLHLDPTALHEYFGPGVDLLNRKMTDLLVGNAKEKYDEIFQRFSSVGVPIPIAECIASEHAMISALDIIDASQLSQLDLEEVARTYFALGERLDLYWFREQLNNYQVENLWEELAREACRDDFDAQQRNLAVAVLQSGKSYKTTDEKINAWFETNRLLLERWQTVLNELKSTTPLTFVMFTVAVNELIELTQNSFQALKEAHQTKIIKPKTSKPNKEKKKVV